MTFAFSRDGAIPGSETLKKLSAKRVPVNAVLMVAISAAIVTLPALVEVNIGTEAEPLIIPVAFFAVTSIAVIGLYLAFAVPIWLRWRMGDKFEAGSWNNGSKYKWMNLIAVVEIIVVSLYLMMPFVPGAVPFSDDFSWKFVNYAPIVTLGALLLLTIWWQSLGQALVHRAEAHDRPGGRGSVRRDLTSEFVSDGCPDPGLVPVDSIRQDRARDRLRRDGAPNHHEEAADDDTPDEPLGDDEMDTTAGGLARCPPATPTAPTVATRTAPTVGDADGTDGG